MKHIPLQQPIYMTGHKCANRELMMFGAEADRNNVNISKIAKLLLYHTVDIQYAELHNYRQDSPIRIHQVHIRRMEYQ